MDDAIQVIPLEEKEKINTSGYEYDLTKHFDSIPEVAEILLREAKSVFLDIENALYSSPAFINVVRAAVPEETLQAVLTDEQKQQLAKGVLKLMTKKDGSLMANLVNPETNRIVKTIPLKSVQMAPEMTQAMLTFSTQMQLAQIAEQIQVVQIAIEEVRMGQEYDRLATAYSCQQKLLQAMEIRDPMLKKTLLMQLVNSAEDSRNLLMLSQKNNVQFIMNEPENGLKKLLQGSRIEKINNRMSEIRESLCAVNMVSFVEALAYKELGEYAAAKRSFMYYSDFIDKTYISVPGLVERLDMIDPVPENYWSKTIPDISDRIKALPNAPETDLLEIR